MAKKRPYDWYKNNMDFAKGLIQDIERFYDNNPQCEHRREACIGYIKRYMGFLTQKALKERGSIQLELDFVNRMTK